MKLIGLVVSGGAVFSKLPQIHRILKTKSVDGLSPSLFLSDVLCNTVTALYHRSEKYPLDTYGECLAFVAQSAAVLLLHLYFSKPAPTPAKLRTVAAGIVAYLWVVIKVLRTPERYKLHLATLHSFVGVVLQASRVPQILANFRTKNTGQLHAVPWLLNAIGSAGRLVTTHTQLGNNPRIAAGFLLSVLTNLTLVYQIHVYKKMAPS
mmetsp:Transcript_37955/g.74666  ORF Transcript_37955/g.74666 Transcript_37955/m.74666 type:complete len:207 (+) Transcript_37955:151-771(+)